VWVCDPSGSKCEALSSVLSTAKNLHIQIYVFNKLTYILIQIHMSYIYIYKLDLYTFHFLL
jgi:hypothetical protein